ncbi:MAG: PAS domain S-box protein [Anaeromyxobacter sp.]
MPILRAEPRHEGAPTLDLAGPNATSSPPEPAHAELEALFRSMELGVVYHGADGRITAANPAACRILGLEQAQLVGRDPVDPEWGAVREGGAPLPADDHPAMVALRTGRPARGVLMGVRTSSLARTRWLRVSATPISKPGAAPHAVLAVFDDLSELVEQERVAAARLRILERASTATLEELLRATLDEAEVLTDSRIGFFHFLEEDQVTIKLQTWSTRTLREMCKADGAGAHYPVAKAGIWADAVRQRRTVVHNDYANAPNRKGLPPGHAPVSREIVVPVLRGGVVRAMIGIGNKAVDYDERDHRIIAAFADLAWDIVDRRRSADALAASERRFRDLTLTLGDWVWELDGQGRFTYVSDTVTSALGWLPSELLGRTPFDLMEPGEGGRVRAELDVIAGRRAPFFDLACVMLHKDGSRRDVLGSGVPVLGPDGAVTGWRGTDRDVTARKRADAERERLREQLGQAQKMESVGRLAGGVAHDFNNMLSAIIGYAELARDDAERGSELAGNLDEILTAARRSADLTRQLLAFARQQPIQPRALDLNDVVQGLLKMLRRLIGENVTLAFVPGAGLGVVEVDPSQVDQVLANLTVNARDAIGDRGRIEIGTCNRRVEAAEAERTGRRAGEYVSLWVKDSGAGMTPDVQARLFEPFFTTKERGKGTGLGLSTVDGIVSQNHGFIEVTSAPGRGSVFEICLPRLAATPSPRGDAAEGAPIHGGHETVLVLEDEDALLRIARATLEGLGYRVIAARTPHQALALATAQVGAIDLVVSDVVLPEMSGVEAVERLRAIRPGAKVLFVSGYPAEAARAHGHLPEGMRLLAKPFGRRELARAVREVLDAPRAAL